jgi:hypothetical protein
MIATARPLRSRGVLGTRSALLPSALTMLTMLGCRGPRTEAPAKDEVWLTPAQMESMRVVLEEVKLEEVDQTLPGVGPVLPMEQCPVKAPADERRACLLVAIDQAALESVHVGTPAVARATDTVHDVFPGQVTWIAGTLDRSGRTVQVECLFDDRMAELQTGRQLRAEVVVGEHPAFAVSRGAVVRAQGDRFVFALAERRQDGRHRFVRTRVRSSDDSGGAWLPVDDLAPGSFVVSRGSDALASMIAGTSL